MRARPRPAAARAASPPGKEPASQRSWKAWWAESRPVHVFIIKFIALLAALHALTLLPLYDWLLPHYLHAIACLANVLTQGCGEGSEVVGTTLRSPAYALTVAPACSAVELACFIGAAVIAFPSPWRAKLSGFLLGACLVALLNAVRVTTLFLVGVHARSAFDLVHEDVWAVLLIMITTLFVAGWIAWVLQRKAPPAKLPDEYAAG